MAKTAADVVKMAKEVQMVDFRFTDMPGTWQHFSIPAHALEEDQFEEGVGFDGSSIRGFQEIHESDMLLIPDPTSAFIDQVLEIPTMVILCDIYDPVTRQPYSRDPRYVAEKPKLISNRPVWRTPASGGRKQNSSCSMTCVTATALTACFIM